MGHLVIQGRTREEKAPPSAHSLGCVPRAPFSRTSTVTDSDPAAQGPFAISKDTEIDAVVGGQRDGFDDGGRNHGEEK